MEQSSRNATPDLDIREEQVRNDNLPTNVHMYNFYQLVELLRKMISSDMESDNWERYCQLIFSANPSLGFAPADVVSLQSINNERLVMKTNFFGLSGAQSPLPGFITEQLVNEEVFGLKQSFFDFFNNRLINLVYQVWRKYRYYVRFQPKAEDDFSVQLLALAGLSDVSLRGETPLNWCKMLAYVGSLSGRNRSPQVVAGVIAHYFDLSRVEVFQWVKRKVHIDSSQQLSLGKQNVHLGVDTVIGEFAIDCKSKFLIRIRQLSLERFSHFLPSGKDFLPMSKLVELLLRDQLSYDLELVLDERTTTDFTLISTDNIAIGWTSFLGAPYREKKVLIQVRK